MISADIVVFLRVSAIVFRDMSRRRQAVATFHFIGDYGIEAIELLSNQSLASRRRKSPGACNADRATKNGLNV
jgi:hypothetical protein